MHHEIKLGYGDTITIHAPLLPLTKIEVVKNAVKSEQIDKYLIFKRVCDVFEITIEDILGKSRRQCFVIARLIISHDLCTNHRLKITAVAKILCRDHSTVLHHLRTYKNLMKTNDEKLITALKQLEYYEKN